MTKDQQEKLLQAAKDILAGFEQGVFVRDISRDGEPGWMLRMIKPLAALGTLQEFVYHNNDQG